MDPRYQSIAADRALIARFRQLRPEVTIAALVKKVLQAEIAKAEREQAEERQRRQREGTVKRAAYQPKIKRPQTIEREELIGILEKKILAAREQIAEMCKTGR